MKLKTTLITGLFLFALSEAGEASIIHGDNVQKNIDFASSDKRFTYTTKLNLWKPTNGVDEKGEKKFGFCSGTALWDWVITSAHCVYKGALDDQAIMGTATLQYRGQRDPVELKITGKILTEEWKTNFNKGYLSTPFDLALLKLEKPVPKLEGVEFFAVNGLPPLSALGFDGAFAGYGYLKKASDPVVDPEKPGTVPREAVAVTNRYQTLPIARGVFGDEFSQTLFERLNKVYWSDLDSGSRLHSPDFDNTLTPFEGISNSGDSGAGVFNGNTLTAINSRRDASYKACIFNGSNANCRKPINAFTYGVVNYATPVAPYLSGIFKKIEKLKTITSPPKTIRVNVSRARANNNDVLSRFDDAESFEEPEVLELIEGVDLGNLEILEEDYQEVLNELLSHYDEVYKNLDNGGNNDGEPQKVPEPTALLGFTILGLGGVIKKLQPCIKAR